MSDIGADQGEMVDIDDDNDVEDTLDGGAIVKIDDKPKAGDSEFYANLAEELDDTEMEKAASQLLDAISKDKEARKKRDEQYEEGIRRTGLGDDAPGGASFMGASRVVHPMLTEVCVDFSSRAIKELFPSSGPVKDNIVGDMTAERVAKAKRKTALMNWQLTTQAQGFRAELEQLLTQVPLGGAQYMKVTWNEDRNRPEFLFVPIDDIYLPFAATNFYSAQRKTHVQYLTQLTYEQRVKSGMYRDVDLAPASDNLDRSKADIANDKIEGKENNSYNEDGLRVVFEIYTFADFGNGDGMAPYIITIDKSTSMVLSIYRNWDEADESQEEQQWIVEFPFVPWRGAYPIGIVHMIGGLSAAATGSLRALLDAAHISNSQTMLKLKGGSRGGQSLNIQPTQVEEIEGGLNVDDIRKIAMPLPFNPPSQVLYALLGFVVDAGKGVVRTTMDDVTDSNQNVPVGTTLAKIEQGMVVFSAIHARLHNAMERMLRILHRLNGLYLDDVEQKEEIGQEIASRSDFSGPMDVVPVSDPNIFSEAQRFAQVQAVAQRSQLLPQLYDLVKVEQRLLETLKIPDPLSLLKPQQGPTNENAVSENVKATLGQPIVAFPEQDHIAHLKTHLSYMLSPTFGSSQMMAPTYLPVILGHIKEHVALWYVDAVFKAADEAAGVDLEQAMKQIHTKEERQAFDRMLAEASLNVTLTAPQAFAALPDAIQSAQKILAAVMPPPPQDPTIAAAMADIAQRGQAAAAKNQVDTAKVAAQASHDQAQAKLEEEKIQSEQALEAARQQGENARKQAELTSKIALRQMEGEQRDPGVFGEGG